MSAANEWKGYWQAWQSAAYYQIPRAGSLVVAGKDREAFIQRQTTNDIHQLSADRALFTVLTSPTARILDVLYLLSEQDHIRVLTLPGMGETTAGFLNRCIFFMDKVTVQDTSAELAQIYLVGPAISKILSSAFSISLPLIDQVVTLPVGDDTVPLFYRSAVSLARRHLRSSGWRAGCAGWGAGGRRGNQPIRMRLGYLPD